MKTVFVLLLLVNSLLASCPSGSVPIPSNLGSEWSCLSIIPSTTGFKKAELQCQRNNGHLVSIPNAFFNAWLTQTLLTVSVGDHLTLKHWIGVRNINGNGWQNIDDNSTTSFFDWSSGEPAQETNSNGCVSQDLKGRWYNDNCDQLYSFVCEVSEIKITTTQATTPRPSLATTKTTPRPSLATTLSPAVCAGQSCNNYTTSCSSNPDCHCWQTQGGAGFCAVWKLCDDYPYCTDCPSTSVCIINSCCDLPRCIPLTTGNNCTEPPTNRLSLLNRPVISTRAFCKENKDCPSGSTCQLYTTGSFCV